MGRRAILIALAALLAVPVWAGGARGVAAAEQCFAQTGYCVSGRFLDYWNAHGGLAINGYPLSDEHTETLEDNKSYTVQYFERVRLEAHPEVAAPNDVQLGQFGRAIHPADPPVGAKTGATFFAQTGHNIAPDIAVFWQANGGLAQFGYPLTEEFTETLEDNTAYTVQYFERARFERHPENAGGNTILLGQFGRRILASKPGAAGCGPLPAPFSGGQTYRDPQGRFTARYANGWAARTEADGNVSVVASSGAGVTLAVADAPGRELNEYKDQILQQIQEPVATNGRFELQCQDRVQVGSLPAYRLRFIHNRTDTPDGSPVPEEIDRILWLANGRSFNANGFLEPDDSAARDLIERIAASVVMAP
jgi:hypothetical protein